MKRMVVAVLEIDEQEGEDCSDEVVGRLVGMKGESFSVSDLTLWRQMDKESTKHLFQTAARGAENEYGGR